MAEGEVLGVVGESGCGKSTLARCLLGLETLDAGRVLWEDEEEARLSSEERRRRRRDAAMVFQNPFASLDPRQKIQEALMEPLAIHGVGGPSTRREMAEKILEEVGLNSEDGGKYPHEFSGGQRQRIALARALVLNPKWVALDEPVSSLDVSVQAAMLNLLARLNRERNLAALFISHDLQVVGYLSRRILVMYLGRVVEEGETPRVLAHPRHPYTRALLEAGREGRPSVQGDPPSPVHPPSGCPFHPRCPLAESRCREEKQALLTTDNGVSSACWKWKDV